MALMLELALTGGSIAHPSAADLGRIRSWRRHWLVACARALHSSRCDRLLLVGSANGRVGFGLRNQTESHGSQTSPFWIRAVACTQRLWVLGGKYISNRDVEHHHVESPRYA